jgi:hypothetical protein
VASGVPSTTSTADPPQLTQNLKVGDCVTGVKESSRILTPKVSCSASHSGEVFAVLKLPAGNYPGQAAIDAKGEQCGPLLDAYADPAKTETMDVFYLYPTASTWRLGDREITCLIGSDTTETTGSVRR